MSRRIRYAGNERSNNRLKCSNQKGRPLVLLAGTTPTDPHHRNYFDDITDFQIDFAEGVLGRDNVVVMCDPQFADQFHRHLPPDVVLEEPMNDIWIRDYAPMRLNQPFRPSYLKKTTAQWIQSALKKFIKRHAGSGGYKNGLVPPDCDLVVEGGNVIDNFVDKLIVCESVIENNRPLSESEVLSRLRHATGLSKIAVVPNAGSSRGNHADDLVTFIDTNVVAISASWGRKTVDETVDAIKLAFGDTVKIVVLDSAHKPEVWRGFESSTGLHVNLVTTYDYLYVPVFGHDPECQGQGQSESRDEAVLDQILANTSKTVVPIEVDHKIGRMGGSLRCLSWTVAGPIADLIVDVARRERRYNDMPEALGGGID